MKPAAGSPVVTPLKQIFKQKINLKNTKDIHTRAHAHARTHEHVHAHEHTHIHTHTHTHTRTHARTHARARARTHTQGRGQFRGRDELFVNDVLASWFLLIIDHRVLVAFNNLRIVV